MLEGEKTHEPLLLWDFFNGFLFEPNHNDSLVEATHWGSYRCWDPAWSRWLFVLLLAVLFPASPPASICKPIHIRKHSQQRVGPWNHSSIRWVWVKGLMPITKLVSYLYSYIIIWSIVQNFRGSKKKKPLMLVQKKKKKLYCEILFYKNKYKYIHTVFRKRLIKRNTQGLFEFLLWLQTGRKIV